MKSITTLVAISVSVVLLGIGSAGAESFKHIRSDKDFRKYVVGKTLSSPSGKGNFRATSDGKISGKVPKGKIVGVWQWSGGFFCRNVRIGSNELGTQCQKVEISGGQLKLTREKGKGDSVVYKMTN